MTDRLTELITRFKDLRIIVFGDFMLDEYLFGEISRVSREAPVLILRYQGTQTLPGGAANTLANVAALGARAIPIGYVGNDQHGRSLHELWPRSVNLDHLYKDASFSTTCKTRILAGSFHSYQQQVVRIDYEHKLELSQKHETRIIDALNDLCRSADALIISDYSLGNLTRSLQRESVRIAREASIPVIVDSRDHPAEYPEATCVTPNITEIEASIGHSLGHDLAPLERTGNELRRKWDVESLLVTRGKLGMSLFLNESCHHIPPFGSAEAVDVSGAGDTVAATCATTLAAGGSFYNAAVLANCAGGLVVMKKGTATVSAAELTTAARQLEKVFPHPGTQEKRFTEK